MLQFKPNSFYRHSAGRFIHIVGEVETTKWGIMLVAEEADHTGHGISCIEVGSEVDGESWSEIGKAEWMRNFLPVEEACKESKGPG